MRSRLLWRRSAAAVGVYVSAVIGFLGTVVAAHAFSRDVLGLWAIVLAASGFFSGLFDLTVEEAVIKFGFRYQARSAWGRLRGLLRAALAFKVTGAVLAGGAMLGIAPAAHAIFGDQRLLRPLIVAAALPLLQSLEGLSGAAIMLRTRYDIRAGFLVLSTSLRLAAIAVAAHHGLTATVFAIVVAQAASTCAIGTAALAALRRFPREPAAPLAEDRRAILSFFLQSSLATGVLSVRGQITPLLLGIVTSPIQVGLFRVAQSPQQGLATLSAPARMVLLTEQTRDWEQGGRQRVFRGIGRYTIAAAALMAVVLPPLIWLMPDLIRIVFGARYGDATNAARVILAAAGLHFVVGWTKSFPVSIGRPSLRVWTHGLETLVLVPLVAVLGGPYGATGAAVATLVAMAVFATYWAVLFLRIRREPREEGAAPEPLELEEVREVLVP